MNTGVGFSEMLVVFTLILVFFGSKELPIFIRKAAQIMAKIRRYSDKLKSELDSINQTLEVPVVKEPPFVVVEKNRLRNYYISMRKSLSPEEHQKKSEEIFNHLKTTSEYQKATAIMIYVSMGKEVSTRNMINEMLVSGKRVVVPYCKEGCNDLGLAEIRDIERDLVKGEYGILEPRVELRDLFFKSDLRLIVCPGVAFDIYGARLGRGKAYYDAFLREFKERTPIIGLAFDCQISKDHLPFDYHDIAMDQVITESGLLIKKTQRLELPAG
jgi:5-formyltetrahydrofolate cyclo-ligase